MIVLELFCMAYLLSVMFFWGVVEGMRFCNDEKWNKLGIICAAVIWPVALWGRGRSKKAKRAK